MRILTCSTLLALYLSVAGVSAMASTTYEFHVSCSDDRFVVQWGIGELDPGKEHLRLTTGTKFPNCNVTDFDPATDSHLPVKRYSDVAAVLEGIPLIGPILCGILGCG